jgi:hypothetical protein
MMNEKRFYVVLPLLTVLVFSLAHGWAWGRTQVFTGKAFDENGALEYIEEHTITYEGAYVRNSLTTYFDADKSVIGYLQTDYMPLPQFCSYTFRDLRRQYTDGVRVETDQICLFRKEGPEAEEETHCLPKDEKQIIGQGFHHFIIRHLEAIVEGEVFHVKLVLPSRFDQLNFRIRKKEIKGKNILIRLEINNWFLRLFSPHVDVVYERKTGRLIRYEGISNVSDASGRFKKVRINYFD